MLLPRLSRRPRGPAAALRTGQRRSVRSAALLAGQPTSSTVTLTISGYNVPDLNYFRAIKRINQLADYPLLVE